jgi:serine phosphatase RsbU (regulator of sigma subunit)
VALIASVVGYLLKSNLENQTREKINNAYQSQVMEARYIGDKVKNQLSNHIQSLKNLASNEANIDNEMYSEYIQATIKNDKALNYLTVFKVSYANKQVSIDKAYGEQSNVVENMKNTNKYYAYYWITDKMFFGKVDGIEGILVSFYNADTEHPNTGYVYSAIVNIDSSLVSQSSTMVFNSETAQVLVNQDSPVDFFKLKELVSNPKLPAGSFSWEKQEEFIGSFSRVGKLILVVYDPKMKIIGQVFDNIQSVLLMGVILLGVAILGMIFLSKTILGPINNLVKATRQIGAGDFDIKIKNKSNDEIGVLASSFEEMSKKMKKLISDKVDMARIENEVNIASTVHKTFFPANEIKEDKFSLHSYYKSATECGGDIWSYIKHENKLIILIGDATGHGLPSAFVTAGVKTCFSLIEKMIQENKFDVTPQNILSFANRAVFDMSKGQIMVTAFVAVIDLNSGEITYSNCGHNPPWIMRNTSKKIESLAGPGLRLGQDASLENIIERKNILEPGDRILFYTDGLMENTTETQEAFGKKAVRKLLESNFANSAQDLLNTLMNSYLSKCKKHEDDLTVVLMEYDMQPQEKEQEIDKEEAS